MDTDFNLARADMLRRQLQRRGIHDRRVLAAMGSVPRERFVPDDARPLAYADRALGIGCSQTISQPYIVALMTQALELTGNERVLEIGTGSGYQTAVLAELAAEVVTIERHEELSRSAQTLLGDLGYTNIHFLVGDGSLGHPALAPYDRVLITAATDSCPPPLLAQLRDGGLLIAPLGDAESQTLQAIRKSGEGCLAIPFCRCRFVPLVRE
jgi:protein-L-isoaspartate(D-aspartate) O-methyltransferase